MERKASKTTPTRDKKASNAPESGTPRDGNQLVRMRSPFHSLKDITRNGPTFALLTQHIQEAGGQPRPPAFSMSLIHAPQGIRATQSPRGPASRACQTIGGGLHGAEPTFDPAFRPATDTRPAALPWRATAPTATNNATLTTKPPPEGGGCVGLIALFCDMVLVNCCFRAAGACIAPGRVKANPAVGLRSGTKGF